LDQLLGFHGRNGASVQTLTPASLAQFMKSSDARLAPNGSERCAGTMRRQRIVLRIGRLFGIEYPIGRKPSLLVKEILFAFFAPTSDGHTMRIKSDIGKFPTATLALALV
jgi:hypothetical protein